MLWNLSAAGHAWVYLNWALGLQENGCDVLWMEALPPQIAPAEAVQRVSTLRRYLDGAGVRGAIVLMDLSARPELEPAAEALARLTLPLEAAFAADLLLNFRYSLDETVLTRFRRSALVDIDPGLLQVWISEGRIAVSPHSMYFTIGETVGRPGALFPDCGIDWTYTPPPVSLRAWLPVPAAGDAPYTTVSSWWAPEAAGKWESFQGSPYNNEKRTTFLEIVDLPSRVPARLELVLGLADDDPDGVLLRERDWSVRRPENVCATPDAYRSYIQRSRGEFSCAKPSCRRFQNAWISDRTLCYLASGKPAVVQHTGQSRFLPDAAGLFRFRTIEEAADAIRAVEADHTHQSQMARALAEAHFDARRVTAAVLDKALS